MKKSILATIFLGLILVLAACGGSNNDSDASNEIDDSAEETEDNSSRENSTANNDFEIVATNWDFDQAEYTVTAGEEAKITLVNEEGMHGIAIDDLDVKIDGDGEATFTPTEPGEYTIYCSIPCGQGHSDMVSTLIVQ
ncbi:cupredoxin domain-containing protein [Pseudogracilibacillus auburnensis]|uniref:Cytochrome c oxidase subunit 2 n=1 Tax=Pseudogracilibacillus auburnensis TaxID=1494959 RepID=A0A2V3WBE5_9BACI|nr:cupredoxin domain-containing protein [Pseudogracilibacillus auburnensis]PXW90474.1 cytochrome c oxidase subunit 2 [Pseudogracilibacillus auburnensis]HLQ98182.1 cupredoxin domain-containing protein [Candidatus Dormibacteraeota bacterium]